jgi:hypothetical protein
VKGIGGIIEGDGNNLSFVIDRRGGIKPVNFRRSPNQVIQVDHQSIAADEGHLSGSKWGVTET